MRFLGSRRSLRFSSSKNDLKNFSTKTMILSSVEVRPLDSNEKSYSRRFQKLYLISALGSNSYFKLYFSETFSRIHRSCRTSWFRVCHVEGLLNINQLFSFQQLTTVKFLKAVANQSLNKSVLRRFLWITIMCLGIIASCAINMKCLLLYKR